MKEFRVRNAGICCKRHAHHSLVSLDLPRTWAVPTTSSRLQLIPTATAGSKPTTANEWASCLCSAFTPQLSTPNKEWTDSLTTGQDSMRTYDDACLGKKAVQQSPMLFLSLFQWALFPWDPVNEDDSISKTPPQRSNISHLSFTCRLILFFSSMSEDYKFILQEFMCFSEIGNFQKLDLPSYPDNRTWHVTSIMLNIQTGFYQWKKAPYSHSTEERPEEQ